MKSSDVPYQGFFHGEFAMAAPLQAVDGRFINPNGKKAGQEGDEWEGSRWRIYSSKNSKAYYQVPSDYAEFLVEVRWETMSGMFNSRQYLSSTTIHFPDGTSKPSPWHGLESELGMTVDLGVARFWKMLFG